MKSRKGEYYIVCHKNGEMYLHKKTGYILDDGKNQYGMCRGEDGLYRITDLKTGALLNIAVPENYSIAWTYIQLQRIEKESGGAVGCVAEKTGIQRSGAENPSGAQGGRTLERDERRRKRGKYARVYIAAAKIVGEELLRKMREGYKP